MMLASGVKAENLGLARKLARRRSAGARARHWGRVFRLSLPSPSISNQRVGGEMLTNTKCLCTPAGAWGSVVGAAMLLLGIAAWAQDQAPGGPNAPALRLAKIISIKGTAASRLTNMYSFGTSFVDPATGLYYLADRSNAAIDVIDTTGAFVPSLLGGVSSGRPFVIRFPDTLFGQIGGPVFNFAGDTGSEFTSGPNGVVAGTGSPCIFVTDSPSRVVSINSGVSFVEPVSEVNTGSPMGFRADKLAYDPKDGLLLVINDADTPPFGTLIKVNQSTCALTVGAKINFTAGNGVNATNGVEQPVWDPMTQRFYVSVPEINGPGGGPNGGIARVNTSGAIEAFYPINFCQPSGLTLGPNDDLLVQCSMVFDLTGKACVTAAPSPPGQPATIQLAECTGTSGAQVVICNPRRGCTPSNGSIVSVPGAGGGDEVWFNWGDGNYYITGENNPVGPIISVVASGSNILTQLLPSLPPVPAVLGVHSMGVVHSVAASAANNHVYVALPANTAYSDQFRNNCVQGCVAVFSASPVSFSVTQPLP